MKKSICLLLAALSVLSIAGCNRRPSREREPKVFESPGGFKVKLPDGIDLKDKTDTMAGVTMRMHFHESRDGVMGAAYADLPIPFGEADDVVEGRLDGARDGMLRAMKALLVKQSKITLPGGYRGREIKANVEKPSGELRARIYLVGTRLFQVLVLGKSGFVNSSDADLLLNSFELTVDPETYRPKGGPIAQAPPKDAIVQPNAVPLPAPNPQPAPAPIPAPNPNQPVVPKKETPAPRKPINAMTAHWTFDKFDAQGVMQDHSGRNNHGTIHFPQGIPGVKGFALVFGGNQNQHFDMGSSPDFDYEDGWDFSYTGFFRTLAPRGTILAQRNPPNGSRGGIFIRIHADGLLCVDILNDSGAMNLMRSRQKVNNGAWHHFAVIREGNTIRVFLDGQAIVEESARGTGAITTKYRYIGSDKAAAEKGEKGDLLSFAGHIDEVRIYQKALSSQEVASLIRAP